ncbi:unnamed protein product [Diamesa hyperborea]
MHRLVSYDHMVTGYKNFCTCSKPVHNYMLKNALNIANKYSNGSWPYEVINLLSNPTYLSDICHLCIARKQIANTPSYRYDLNIEEGFKSFIDQVEFDLNIDRKTAAEEVKSLLGLSRWVNEDALYRIVKDLFPDKLVFREASPKWLERMRFDIFIPELNLAIEYQGQQHYQPVSVFGGIEGHTRTLERDALKKKLCEKHGINLMEVRYDSSISMETIRNRLRKFI